MEANPVDWENILEQVKPLVSGIEFRYNGWLFADTFVTEVHDFIDFMKEDAEKIMNAIDVVKDQIALLPGDVPAQLAYLEGKRDALTSFLESINTTIFRKTQDLSAYTNARQSCYDAIQALSSVLLPLVDQLDKLSDIAVDSIGDALFLSKHTSADYIFTGDFDAAMKLRFRAELDPYVHPTVYVPSFHGVRSLFPKLDPYVHPDAAALDDEKPSVVDPAPPADG